MMDDAVCCGHQFAAPGDSQPAETEQQTFGTERGLCDPIRRRVPGATQPEPTVPGKLLEHAIALWWRACEGTAGDGWRGALSRQDYEALDCR